VVALKRAVPLPLHAPCTPSGSKIKLGDGARGKGTNAGLRAVKSLTPRGPAGAMTGGSEGAEKRANVRSIYNSLVSKHCG